MGNSTPQNAILGSVWESGSWGSIKKDSPAKLLPPILKLLTYNVWFEDHFFEDRCGALFAIFKDSEAHLICLQEVTPRFLRLLIAEPWAQQYIFSDISGATVSPYGVLMLVQRDMGFSGFTMVGLPTRMSRSLLVTTLALGEATKFTIATVHLESLDHNASIRQDQLSAIFPVLADSVGGRALRALPGLRGGGGGGSDSSSVVLCGDFNFSDHFIEQSSIDAEYVDCWRARHPHPWVADGGLRPGVTGAAPQQQPDAPAVEPRGDDVVSTPAAGEVATAAAQAGDGDDAAATAAGAEAAKAGESESKEAAGSDCQMSLSLPPPPRGAVAPPAPAPAAAAAAAPATAVPLGSADGEGAADHDEGCGSDSSSEGSLCGDGSGQQQEQEDGAGPSSSPLALRRQQSNSSSLRLDLSFQRATAATAPTNRSPPPLWRGYTMPETTIWPPWRPDRVLLRSGGDGGGGGAQLLSVVRVGMADIGAGCTECAESKVGTACTPSDHYGLLAEFALPTTGSSSSSSSDKG